MIYNNCTDTLLESRICEEGLGVFTTSDVPADATLMVIPYCSLILPMNADPVPVYATRREKIAMLILWDIKNPDSRWKAYYRGLPSCVGGLLSVWSDEDLSYLSGSHVLESAKKCEKKLVDSFTKMFPYLPSCTEFQDYALVCSWITSRCFSIKVGGTQTAAMVPCADLMNHKYPFNAIWHYEDSTQNFVVKSRSPILAGCQVFDSYGWKCNSQLLLSYGFCINNKRTIFGNPNKVRIFIHGTSYMIGFDTSAVDTVNAYARCLKGDSSPAQESKDGAETPLQNALKARVLMRKHCENATKVYVEQNGPDSAALLIFSELEILYHYILIGICCELIIKAGYTACEIQRCLHELKQIENNCSATRIQNEVCVSRESLYWARLDLLRCLAWVPV